MHLLALDCGYYDQSHFINDFNKLIGNTPENFLQGNQTYLKNYRRIPGHQSFSILFFSSLDVDPGLFPRCAVESGGTDFLCFKMFGSRVINLSSPLALLSGETGSISELVPGAFP